MTDAEQIEKLVEQVIALQASVIALQASALTALQAFGMMGGIMSLFTGLILGFSVSWNRQLKATVCSQVATSKTDMRVMLKDMLQARLETHENQVVYLRDSVKGFFEQFNKHMDKYHTKGE